MKNAKSIIVDVGKQEGLKPGTLGFAWCSVLVDSVNDWAELNEYQEDVLRSIVENHQEYDVLAVGTWVNTCGQRYGC